MILVCVSVKILFLNLVFGLFVCLLVSNFSNKTFSFSDARC